MRQLYIKHFGRNHRLSERCSHVLKELNGPVEGNSRRKWTNVVNVMETLKGIRFQLSSVQSLSRVWLLATPWTAARQASLSMTNSRSSPELMSIESVMPSSHLILCRPLLLLPSIFPSIRVFSNESALRIRWLKYWSFSFNIRPSSEPPGLISLQSKGLSRVYSNTTVQKHQFFSPQLSL